MSRSLSQPPAPRFQQLERTPRAWIGRLEGGRERLVPDRLRGRATLEWLTLAALFLLYTRLSDLHRPAEWPLSLAQVLLGLTIGAAVVDRLVVRRVGLAMDRVLGWMLAYAAVMLLSRLAADLGAVLVRGELDLGAVLGPVARGVASDWFLRDLLVVFALSNLIVTRAHLEQATWTLIAGGAFIAAAVVFYLFTGNELGGLAGTYVGAIVQGERGGRLTGGAVDDPNDFARMLVVVVPLALYQVWCARRRALRIAALATLLLLTFVIVQTFSRGGLLALLVVLGLAAVLQRRKPARLLAVGLVVFVIAISAPQLYWARTAAMVPYVARVMPQQSIVREAARTPFDGLARDIRKDGSLAARLKLWQVGALMFLEHPLLGVGRGNYYAAYMEFYWRVDPGLPWPPKGPHNMLVHIAAQTGLLGLATFGGAVVAALAGLRSGSRRLAAAGFPREALLLESIELAIYAFLVAAMFLNDTLHQRYLWLAVGLAVAARQLMLRGRVGSEPARC